MRDTKNLPPPEGGAGEAHARLSGIEEREKGEGCSQVCLAEEQGGVVALRYAPQAPTLRDTPSNWLGFLKPSFSEPGSDVSGSGLKSAQKLGS